jgi:hypothetical protein
LLCWKKSEALIPFLLELFLKDSRKKSDFAQNPDELIKDLPDFPGLAKKNRKAQN